MRIWIVSLICCSTIGLIAVAQTRSDNGDPPIVIKPMRPGEAEKEPAEKNGFIVIRPNGKATTTTQVGEPKQPPPASVQVAPKTAPTPGILNVPPPSNLGTGGKENKVIFDYWFAVGIEGQ